MNSWIRLGIVLLVVAALILAAGLLLSVTTEHDALGTVDCGTALSVDDEIESTGARHSCEEAATDRRTLVYLLAGAAGGVGVILLGFGWPQSGDRRRRHPFL